MAIDAATVENPISPRLYGQFAEFMFENIKFGMHAELLRNRGFEEAANEIGLPREWDRNPDNRNDDRIRFEWDDSVSYPPSRSMGQHRVEHSLRIDLPAQDGQRRGVHQGRLPVREGIEYRGSGCGPTTSRDVSQRRSNRIERAERCTRQPTSEPLLRTGCGSNTASP